MKLYEIDKSIINILESEEDKIIDFETGEVLKLDEIIMERKEKLENIGCLIKNLEAETMALRQEEIKLQERRKVKENKIDYLKNYITNSMQTFGDSKIETARIVLSLRKDKSVKIIDEELIPERYKQVKINISKSEIRALLKAGINIDGAELEEKQSLQIK